MRKMTLYRSLLIGMTVMLIAVFLGTLANLLCVLDVLSLVWCFATHGCLFFLGCAVPCICFILRMRDRELFWQPEQLLAGSTPLLILGMILIMLLVVWVGSFTAALLL